MQRGIIEVVVTSENGDEYQFGLPRRGRVILYPDGILNIEDSGRRTTACRWDVLSVRLLEVEPLREMA